MHKMYPRSLALGACLWLAVAAFGCGPAPTSNLSPTAEQDPDRHRKAVRETEEKARRDREAERKAFQRASRPRPSVP